MKRRRKLPPDKELAMFEVEPSKIQQYYQGKMFNHPAPSYEHDPSYFWAKDRK